MHKYVTARRKQWTGIYFRGGNADIMDVISKGVLDRGVNFIASPSGIDAGLFVD